MDHVRRRPGLQIVVIVGLVAVTLPLLTQVATSSLMFLLISPFLVIPLALLFLFIHVLFGFTLDTMYPSPPPPRRPSARPLAFSTPAAWQAVVTRSLWSTQSPQNLPPLAPSYPVLSSSLNEILIMIVRDFVLEWYKKLSSSPSFPTTVSTTLHGSLENFFSRVTTLDLPSFVVHRILPKVTAHVEQFRESEIALRGAGLERHLTESEELNLLLAGRYAGPRGKLHPAVANLASAVTKQSEEDHLRGLMDRALPLVLPPDAAASKAVRVVVREIITCTVLAPVMDMLADPDFWNRAIDQLAGEAIRQQKLISKVRRILETQSPESRLRPSSAAGPPRSEDINLRTDPRRFESFLRSINRCDSLLDARRLKNDIVGEVRRTRALLANHEKDDWINGEKTEDIVAYLDRLYTAKRKVEKRIVVLGGVDDSRHSVYHDSNPTSMALSRLTLRDVLINPSSLSYFMEFMDRRNRSLLVQFWLTVESFKNPLESVDSSDEDSSKDLKSGKQSAATVKEDMTMIYDLYFSTASSSATLSAVSQRHVDAIRSFVLDSSASSSVMERRVRKSVLRAQKEVEEELEHDFERFERSDLWFRAVGDLEPRSSARKSGQQSSPVPPALIHRGSAPPALAHPETAHAKSILSRGGGRVGKTRPRPKFLLPSAQKAETSPTASSPPDVLPRAESWESTSSMLGESYVETAHPRPLPSKLDLLISPTSEDDHDTSRLPLFDEPQEPTPSQSPIGEEHPSQERMEAIQAALIDIIADDKRSAESPRNPLFPGIGHTSSRNRGDGYDIKQSEDGNKQGIFDGSGDEEDQREAATDDPEDRASRNFELAGPGDLQLSYDIERLGENIVKLQSQDAMLDTLIRKAELTGDTQELRLLNRSKSAIARELRELTFQKMQYEQQDADNRLIPERTRVSISNSAVSEDDGKSVVRYLVEVQQLAIDGTFASGWVVARRYNEFFNMHQGLKDKYLVVRNLEFPGKRLVTSLSSSFVDTRRISLEKYLQSLIAVPIVCESDELRAFLSRQAPLNVTPIDTSGKPQPTFPGQTIVRTVYRSVAESIDDMLFGPSMLEVMIQRLTRQAAEFAGIVGVGMTDEDFVAQAFKLSGKLLPEETLMKFPGVLKPLDGETSASTFSAPICDLTLAVFELNKKNSWLRRQAIVIILQQVLGGTIERKLRDTFRVYMDESHLLRYLNIFRDNLWPGGYLRPPSVPRTLEEKSRTRDEANRKLSTLVPDLAANTIGRSNARRGARRIFAVLQNRRLNQHIVYTIVDEVFAALFPEAVETP